MKKVITTMLVAAMVLSMAVPTSAATITRKKSTGTSASTTKVSGDYSLKMVDKTLQFIRGGKVVSSIETKDGKITLRKSSAGGISVVFTDANGKRRNITLGKQDSVSLSGTFTQVSVDKALGSSFEVEMEKGSKVTNFYAKGAAKVTLNGSVTTLNVTSSNGNVDVNGTVTRAYAVNKKAITGMSSGKITQTSTGTSASGSVNTSTGSSSSSNTTVNSGSGSSGSSSSGSSGIIINGGGSNNGGNTTSKKNPTVSYKTSVLPTYDEGTVLTNAMLEQFGLKATYGNATVAGTFSWTTANTKVLKGTYSYSVTFTPKDTKTYNTVRTSVKIEGKAVQKAQTLAEAKAAIEAALKSSGFTNETTEAQIQKLADDCITSSDIQAVAKVTIVKATETAEGTIKGTIELTKGTETATVTVDLKIAKLSALQAAKAEVEAALDSFVATKETTKDDIVAALDTIDKKYTSVDISVGDVTVVEADKKVSVVVTLKEGEATDTVSKTWTYTEQASALEEAKAKVVAALDGITPSKDIDKAAIEAALATIKSEYPTVDIVVGDVVPNEAAKTVSVEVTLKEGEKTDKVAKTWDYSGQAVAKAPTFIDNLDKTTEEIQLDTANPVTFTVKASVDGTTEEGVTYTWYKSTVKETSDETARKVIGTGNSYTLTTSDLSNDYYYYFVIATNTVDGVSESTPSDVKMIKVVLPEGSAEAPVVTISGGDSYTLGNAAKDITANVTGVTPGTTKLTYEWYKADSINDVGTKVGTDSATYKPSTSTAGVAYYYVKVTNTDSAVTTGLKSVTTTSERVKVTVTAPGTVTAKPVDNNKGTETVAIDVTFNPALPKDTMDSLTIADFEIEGEVAAAHNEKCTLALLKHTIPTTPANTIRLYLTGVDKAENATLTLKKDLSDTGISISDSNKKMSVAINFTPAPAEAAKVKEIEAVENKSSMDKTLDTKEIKLTFDKELVSAPASLTFTYGKNATELLINSNIVLDVSDKKVVTAQITVPAGTTATEVLTLTKLDGTAVAEADQKTVTINRDIEAPEVVNAVLDTDNTTIKVQFTEPLAGTPGTGFVVKDNDGNPVASGTTPTAFNGSDTSMVRITLDKAADNTTKLPLSVTYTATPGDLTDTSLKGNALATFTMAVADKVPVKKLAIKDVTVDTTNVSAPVVTVEMNDRVAIEGGTITGTDLFEVTGNNSGNKYPVTTIATDTVTPRSYSLKAADKEDNAFKITLGKALQDGDTGVKVKINPASEDAKKVTAVSNPQAGMDNAETTVKPSDEVKVPSMTYGTQTAIKAGTVGAADVELYAKPSILNFTPALTNGYSWVLTASGSSVNALSVFKLDPDTGAISAKAGENLVAGTTDVTVTATDADGNKLTAELTITVDPAGSATITDVTSAAMTAKTGDDTVTITLTGGKFKDGTITKADFEFDGTNKTELEGGSFARTSDTVVTITGVTLAAGSDDTVKVLGATQATQASGVTMVSSKAATPDTAITEVELTGDPAAALKETDKVPTIGVTPDASKFSAAATSYTVDGNNSSAGALLTGKGGTDVVATIVLTAESGYSFKDFTKAMVKGITDGNGTVAVSNPSANSVTITVTYTVEAAKTEITDVTVGDPSLTLKKSTGQDVAAAITAVKNAVTANGFTVGTPVAKVDNTAETGANVDLTNNTTVTFEVVLTPDGTHEFKSQPNLTGTATSWSAAAPDADGKVTLTYTLTLQS